MELDVVCGMEVDPSEAVTLEHDGRLYHFCSRECLEAFKDEPDVFIGDDARSDGGPSLPH